MRVLHLITNMLASGGAEVMLLRLARASAEDRPIIVSLMDVSDRHQALVAEYGLDVRSLNARSTAGLLGAGMKLGRIIRDESPDAVMCWLYHAMIVGQLGAWHSRLDVPVYWNVRQSLDDIGSLSASTRMALRLTRLLSSRPAGIVFNSRRALDLHRSYGYRNQNCIVIPNGFDPVPHAPVGHVTPTVFGIAGRLHRQKDYGTFFAAAAQVHRAHPDARFIAAGAGLTPDSDAVRHMLDAAGLPADAVELRGNVSDMVGFYRDIDCLVLSSRTEGFPNVVAEAMSLGKPVISTDVGDAAAIVEDTGFIVPASDPPALAEAMKRMVSIDPSRYAAMSRAARQRIESTYSLQHVAARYRAFLCETARDRCGMAAGAAQNPAA
ncbi:glycosyltransferase [Arvimicrobium flavum]|uniref:glycosyltransferase n=1 Tax=Arvimicrobium flavum TaxID=3393320 RepID=UPI00237B8313|nr:glycosyltransferase [Mesorhizobium shangrilense]